MERSLVKITAKQEHEVTLTIPPYPGDELLVRFAADLDRLLGRGMGDKVFSTYQVAILRDNQGFGEYTQTYVLHRNGNLVEYKQSWKMPLRAPAKFAWVDELFGGVADSSIGGRLPLDQSLYKLEFLREFVPQ